MKAASTIFQNSAVDSVSIMMCGFLQFDVLPPRCSSRVETLSFDPQVAMNCLDTLCQFRLDVGTCFANSSFAERCEHSFLFLIVQTIQVLFPHISAPKVAPPFQALVQAKYLRLCSLLVVPIYIAISIFPSEEGVRCWFVPERVYPERCTLVC